MSTNQAKHTHLPTDIPRDEARRELREIDRDHQLAKRQFRAALDQAFDPDAEVDAGDKARLLGLPDRRGFLRIGGLSIAVSALAAACVQQTKDPVQVAQTGTLVATSSTSTPP